MGRNGSMIGRRRLLTGGAALAGAAALAACTPETATPPPAQAPAKAAATSETSGATPAAAGKPGAAKVVGAIVQASWAEIGMRDATLAYNEQVRDKGVQVNLEDTASGWEQKVLAMIKDKSLAWSAHGYVPFFNAYAYIKSGLAAPSTTTSRTRRCPGRRTSRTPSSRAACTSRPSSRARPTSSR
jgi:hypothetical protein